MLTKEELITKKKMELKEMKLKMKNNQDDQDY